MPWNSLAAARHLAGSAACLLLDRTRKPLVDGVPRTLAAIDAAWLESVLREHEPRVVVESVAHAGGHSGTTTRQRLRIRVREADVPPSLFVKITPMGVLQRVFGHAMRLGEMEVRFYRELAGEVPVRVPRVYTARASRGHARFVLLLEDVAQSGATLVNVGGRASAAQARSVVRALAVLHAAYWESPRFDADLAWLRCRERPAQDRPLEALLTAQMLRRSTRLAGSLRTSTFDRAVTLLSERRDAVEAVWSTGACTLVHGDTHIGNLFFVGDAVGFLDWQVLARAPGMRDVAYFIASSLPSELACPLEKELIGLYLEGLAAAGVAAPSAEVAWSQYRAFALYGWLAAAFTVGAGGLQEERNARAGLARATRTIERLGSTELFDD